MIFSQPPAYVGFIRPESYGAAGDGTTDDYAAFTAAIAAVIALGGTAVLKLTAGATYSLSEAAVIENTIGIQVWGSNSTILFPSDDAALTNTDTEHVAQQRRSGFYLRNTRDCVVRDVRFRGEFPGDAELTGGGGPGAGVYARRSAGLRIERCQHEWGGSLYLQDAVADSTGGSNSKTIAVSGTTVTLTDTSGDFHAGMLGAPLFVSGCSNVLNDGQYRIASVVSTTQITYENADAVNETSTFRWTVNDGDRNTLIDGCTTRNPRHYCSAAATDTTYRHCRWEYSLEHADASGRGDRLTISGTTVTLTDAAAKFKPSHHGRPIVITGATTSANNVTAIATYISSTQISFTNASGVTEAYDGQWYIAAGDRVGQGTGSLTFDGSSTMTITSSVDVFQDDDVNRAVHIFGTTNNDGVYSILSVISPTQATYRNGSGVDEAFSMPFTVDTWDYNTGVSASTHGSTHGVYVFAGRSNVKVLGCSFYGNRTACVKVSGTSSPIGDVLVDGCTFQECGEAFLFGADDANDHAVARFTHNTLIDCATNRPQWATGALIGVLGARGVRICGNDIYYTRDHSAEFDNSGNLGGADGIQVKRYHPGASQPVEDVLISGNRFFCDRKATARKKALATAIELTEVGVWGKSGTGTLSKQSTSVSMTVNATAGTFTRATGSWLTDGYEQGGTFVTSGFTNAGNNATWTIASVSAFVITVTSTVGLVDETKTASSTNNVMTLTHSNAYFSLAGDVGKTVTFVNSADAANDGPFTIISVPSRTTFKFVNASGVAGSSTYRIPGRNNCGSVVVENNYIADCATTGIKTTNCVGPEVRGNQFNGLIIDYWTVGDCTPRAYGNRELSRGTTGATFYIGASTGLQQSAWPVFYDNIVTNPQCGSRANASNNRDIGIGLGNSTAVDFPLLGKQGKVRPSGGYEEVVFAYGDKHVDGDTLAVKLSGVTTTFTYKSSSPGASQFSTKAELLTLLNAVAGLAADDYGTGFSSGDVATGHIRVRRTVQSTSDGNLSVISNTLHPTALVALYNDSASNAQSLSRGCQSSGPVADKTVIWSPMASWTGVAILVPETTAGRTALSGGPAMHIKNSLNGGCCEVMQHDAVVSGEEFRFLLGGN